MIEAKDINLPDGLRDGLNHMANYEPKALAWLALNEMGSATISGIDRAVSDKTGIETRYSGFAKSAIGPGFVSFEDRPSRYSSRLVRHYQTDRIDDALPAIGTVLSWANEHELPVQPFIGGSQATETARQRGPINSLRILATIINGESIVDSDYTRCEGTVAVNRIDGMLNAGVIEVDDEVNRFLIDDPSYTGTTPRERVSEETIVVYDALALAKESDPDKAWSVDEILELAETLRTGDASKEWTKNVRKNIKRAAYATQSCSFNGAVHKQEYTSGDYVINPEYSDAVYDLLERVIFLGGSNPSQQKRLADTAVEIYRHASSARGLVERGLDSNKKRKFSLGTA